MTPLLRYWLPLVIWMFVIFSASADSQSTQRTSRFLDPFLRWLKPDISAQALNLARLVVRKMAHATEYAVLSWLAWRVIRHARRDDERPWSWANAGFALGFIFLYAAVDEFHQTFVPNRTGSIQDVSIDTLGGILGLGLVWIIQRRRRH